MAFIGIGGTGSRQRPPMLLKMLGLFAGVIATLALAACASTPGRDKPISVIVSTAFSPDGRLIAVSTAEEEVALFDAQPLRFKRMLTQESDKKERLKGNKLIESIFRPLPVVFSQDGTLLAAGGIASSVVVWDVESGAEKFRVPAGEQLQDIAFLPDGQSFVMAGPDVEIHSARDGARTAEVMLPPDVTATAAAVSPDGQTLIVGLSNGDISIVAVSTQAIVRRLHEHDAPVTGLAFAPDGMAFASTAGGYDLRLWKRDESAQFEHGGPPISGVNAAPSNAGAQAAGGLLWLLGTISGARIVGAPTMGAPPVVPGSDTQFAKAAHTIPYYCGSRVAFSGNGRYIASSANLLMCADCFGTLAPPFLVLVHDLEKGTAASARDSGCAVSISPDGKVLATGGRAGSPELRDSATARPLETQQGGN